MHALANPLRFQRIADAILPWCLAALVVMVPIGLVWALVISPPDYQQGQSVRIMYVHVPSAWMALFVYFVMAVASASALIWKHPVAAIVAKASAPIGAGFTAVALFSGSVWGKPMWGTWWVWDARLTSFLILFFLYLGYIALHEAFDDRERSARAAAILAIVGVINLPIIKFSVDWWNTLHQGSTVFRMDGPTMATSMLWPLLFMTIVFKLYYVAALCLRVRGELAGLRIAAIRNAAGG